MRLARATLLVLAIVLVGCGDDDTTAPELSDDAAATAPIDDARAAMIERLDELDAAIDDWASATSIRDAELTANSARLLIEGDSDTTGLLPGRDGTPGLASALAGCDAVDRDVLGGSWEDPTDRWATLDAAIAGWRPDNNTFPSLPSHPQRVVGWATLTVESGALELAHEYAGDAVIHARVSREAVEAC